jgi:transposase-like protein
MSIMTVRKCPACGSRDITLDTGGQTGKWRCKKCGYVGVLVLEED